MSANFTPNKSTLEQVAPFRHFCQKVLPLTYDDSLSYYELLCKVVNTLNKNIENNNLLNEDMGNLYVAYEKLEGYVNFYFENLDTQEMVDKKLDEMADSGQLNDVVAVSLNEAISEGVDEIGRYADERLSHIEDIVKVETPNFFVALESVSENTIGYNKFGNGCFINKKKFNNNDIQHLIYVPFMQKLLLVGNRGNCVLFDRYYNQLDETLVIPNVDHPVGMCVDNEVLYWNEYDNDRETVSYKKYNFVSGETEIINLGNIGMTSAGIFVKNNKVYLMFDGKYTNKVSNNRGLYEYNEETGVLTPIWTLDYTHSYTQGSAIYNNYIFVIENNIFDTEYTGNTLTCYNMWTGDVIRRYSQEGAYEFEGLCYYIDTNNNECLASWHGSYNNNGYICLFPFGVDFTETIDVPQPEGLGVTGWNFKINKKNNICCANIDVLCGRVVTTQDNFKLTNIIPKGFRPVNVRSLPNESGSGFPFRVAGVGKVRNQLFVAEITSTDIVIYPSVDLEGFTLYFTYICE